MTEKINQLNSADIKKAPLQELFFGVVVPGTGLEPARR